MASTSRSLTAGVHARVQRISTTMAPITESHTLQRSAASAYRAWWNTDDVGCVPYLSFLRHYLHLV